MKIKLMADYGCFPLWYNESDKCGDINPESLPLTQSTINRLHKWSDLYNTFLDWSDPGNSPEVPDDVWEAFKQEGKELWKLLQLELGLDYKVSYKEP
jgi:hypothetical protein